MAGQDDHTWKCKICGKTFLKAHFLNIHIRSHTGEKPYYCPHDGCDKEYRRSDHLRRHMLAAHWVHVQKDASTPPPVFSCDEDGCSAKFRSSQNLKKHIRRAHEAESFKCHICGAVFKKHHQLSTHRAEHSQANKNICEVEGCGRVFKFPNKLRKHVKIHEGYTCKEEGCGEKFDKWTLLVKHNKLNHGPVYKCSICDKAFHQKNRLKNHIQVHSDERTVYSCTFENCSREYLHLRNLTLHIKTYHGGKRHPCTKEGCGQTFCTKQKLQQHLKLHDPTIPLPPRKKPKKKSIAEKLTGCKSKNGTCELIDSVLNSPEMENRMNSPDLSNFDTLIDFDINLKFNLNKSTEFVSEKMDMCKTVKECVSNNISECVNDPDLGGKPDL